jgi:hypothetical protein
MVNGGHKAASPERKAKRARDDGRGTRLRRRPRPIGSARYVSGVRGVLDDALPRRKAKRCAEHWAVLGSNQREEVAVCCERCADLEFSEP